MNSLAKSLVSLKEKVDSLEINLVAQTKELDNRGLKWFEFDDKKQKLIENGAERKIVKINVGGKVFQCSLLTILNNPDCLFFNLIMTDNWNYEEEIFFDRSFKYFPIVLSYLRNNKVNLDGYSDEQIPDITLEAKYYNIVPLIEITEKYVSKIFLVNFEFSGEYRSGDQLAGTNNVEDLNDHEDTSCMKGICTAYTGWIILELNREVDVEKIEIGGYRGNTNLYASSNGSGASILTSLDKSSWTQVGVINSSYANTVYLHEVTPSRAKYIKLNHNSYLGIGYFRVVR